MRILVAALCLVACAAPRAARADIVGHMTPAEPLTEARVAGLAAPEREAWLAYLARSRARMAADQASLAAERADGAVPAAPPHAASGDGGMPLGRPAAWYGSPEARRVADNIVSFQTPAGGWGKNTDRTGPARQRGQHYIAIDTVPGAAGPRKEVWSFVGTIDNGATIAELRFLARAQAQAAGAAGHAYRDAFIKGARYLLEAQYPNGGYPQVYPLQGGYHDAITFNDNAMAAVTALLGEIAAGKGDYAFVPAPVAGEAREAAGKALRLILATQQVVGGARTGWCQQHDALTLAPVGARNFEPPSLASAESAQLLNLLMRPPGQDAAIEAAVHAGAAWLKRVAVADVAWSEPVSAAVSASAAAEGRKLVAKPGAGPLWSRFYDIATMKPVFGDRDRSIHDDVNELGAERRGGYGWYGDGPAKTLDSYARWSRGHPPPAAR
ncbi:pectate lyase [Pseudoduganella namucuonensis]|uniref:Pectate lyase, PelA/Pel-15E family n=1 Tax=Pseudoduganella namucuonensis TaxID=1035707 RepID=A0A1I7LMS5_9BURK|nr:pectate lyase [Pseudoduganella namucuonensis]SFV10991.1 pectate lyase, PelA/Pel-15E family [Pseudoduganella namucuonensis]